MEMTITKEKQKQRHFRQTRLDGTVIEERVKTPTPLPPMKPESTNKRKRGGDKGKEKEPQKEPVAIPEALKLVRDPKFPDGFDPKTINPFLVMKQRTHWYRINLNSSQTSAIAVGTVQDHIVPKPEEISFIEKRFPEKRHIGAFNIVFARDVANFGFPYKASKIYYDAEMLFKPIAKMLMWVRKGYPLMNEVMVIRYKNGCDNYGEHSDDDPHLLKGYPIVTIFFGAPRKFVIKQNKIPALTPEQVNDMRMERLVSIEDGMVIVMEGKCQGTHIHSIMKEPAVKNKTISFTFRALESMPEDATGKKRKKKSDEESDEEKEVLESVVTEEDYEDDENDDD